MATQIDVLKAELEAITLWDWMYANNPISDQIDEDALTSRLLRRVQIELRLQELARMN